MHEINQITIIAIRKQGSTKYCIIRIQATLNIALLRHEQH
jgi:hypothetical protein